MRFSSLAKACACARRYTVAAVIAGTGVAASVVSRAETPEDLSSGKHIFQVSKSPKHPVFLHETMDKTGARYSLQPGQYLVCKRVSQRYCRVEAQDLEGNERSFFLDFQPTSPGAKVPEIEPIRRIDEIEDTDRPVQVHIETGDRPTTAYTEPGYSYRDCESEELKSAGTCMSWPNATTELTLKDNVLAEYLDPLTGERTWSLFYKTDGSYLSSIGKRSYEDGWISDQFVKPGPRKIGSLDFEPNCCKAPEAAAQGETPTSTPPALPKSAPKQGRSSPPPPPPASAPVANANDPRYWRDKSLDELVELISPMTGECLLSRSGNRAASANADWIAELNDKELMTELITELEAEFSDKLAITSAVPQKGRGRPKRKIYSPLPMPPIQGSTSMNPAVLQTIIPHWEKRLPRLSEIRVDKNRRLSPADLAAADIVARTIFGEMGVCFAPGNDYPRAFGRLLLNRVQAPDDLRPHFSFKTFMAAKLKKTKPGREKRKRMLASVSSLINHPLIDVSTAPMQFSTWNNEQQKNLKQALCPPRSRSENFYLGERPSAYDVQRWKDSLKIALQMILYEKEFLKDTKGVNTMWFTSWPTTHWEIGLVHDPNVSINGRKLDNPGCMMFWNSPANSAKAPSNRR